MFDGWFLADNPELGLILNVIYLLRFIPLYDV